MIEINLNPGASRKSKGRGPSFSLAGVFGGSKLSIKEPFMIVAIVGLLGAAGSVGMLYVSQASKSSTLAEREVQAVADSTRFAAVLRQRAQAEAKRDSVQKQLEVIKAIDADRFIWPHVMDEVSRALPPYTWLKNLIVAAPQTAPAGTGPALAPGDTTTKPVVPELMRFRVVGQTVDIQALTRFMKLLEASPFIQSVQLARSEMAMFDGKEVTEFILDATYERPDSSMIVTAPVSVSVR